MFAKLHESESEIVLAACDEELLGKRLKNDKLEFHVSERFYGSKEVTKKELGEMLDKCTIANLVGQKVINVAKEKRVIEDKHVMRIGSIPHAQMIRMRS